MTPKRSIVTWIAVLFLGAAWTAAAQSRDPGAVPAAGPPTCDAAQIAPDSYALTTSVQAEIVMADRTPWWARFSMTQTADELKDLNFGSMYAAERALAIDPRNLLAHALVARQYVVLGIDAARAEAEWRTALDHGAAVVWTATLYDVDVKSYFVLAFDRQALRVYRFGEFAAPFETHLGMPKFPGPERERFWRAWAGCIPADARPEAVIPWSEVREIRAGNWVLYFKLAHTVTIGSDRGSRKELDEIKVNLHGASGMLDVRVEPDPIDPWKMNVRAVGIGPLAYQERVRRTLVKLVDPEGRIVLPKASKRAGW